MIMHTEPVVLRARMRSWTGTMRLRASPYRWCKWDAFGGGGVSRQSARSRGLRVYGQQLCRSHQPSIAASPRAPHAVMSMSVHSSRRARPPKRAWQALPADVSSWDIHAQFFRAAHIWRRWQHARWSRTSKAQAKDASHGRTCHSTRCAGGAERTVALTWCPASRSCHTISEPKKPPAPETRTVYASMGTTHRTSSTHDQNGCIDSLGPPYSTLTALTLWLLHGLVKVRESLQSLRRAGQRRVWRPRRASEAEVRGKF